MENITIFPVYLLFRFLISKKSIFPSLAGGCIAANRPEIGGMEIGKIFTGLYREKVEFRLKFALNVTM